MGRTVEELLAMKTETDINYTFTHLDEEVVTADFDHDDWKKVGFGRKPDARRIYPDGSERWYYMTEVGGRDEEGPYQQVLDGPAQGERAYV